MYNKNTLTASNNSAAIIEKNKLYIHLKNDKQLILVGRKIEGQKYIDLMREIYSIEEPEWSMSLVYPSAKGGYPILIAFVGRSSETMTNAAGFMYDDLKQGFGKIFPELEIQLDADFIEH